MNGRIIEIKDKSYTIEVRPISSSCEGCGGGCSCQSKTVKFEAINQNNLNPSVGDVIKLDLDKKKALRDGLIFFILPLLLLSISYFTAIYAFGLSAEKASLAGLAGLAAGFGLIYIVRPEKQKAVIESIVFTGK